MVVIKAVIAIPTVIPPFSIFLTVKLVTIATAIFLLCAVFTTEIRLITAIIGFYGAAVDTNGRARVVYMVALGDALGCNYGTMLNRSHVAIHCARAMNIYICNTSSVISNGIEPTALIFISKGIAIGPTGRTELAQPVKNKGIECSLLVGIALYAGHNVVINDEKRTPLLIGPRVTRNGLKGYVAIKVCYYYKRRVHALNGATTIAALVAPVHTGLPVIVIIAHGHVIHRVDRKTHSAMIGLLVEATGMREAELLETGEVIGSCDLGKHLYRLTTSINMENLTIGHREVKRRSSIRVASKIGDIAKTIIHLTFTAPRTSKASG
jgi:uncharacterized membrane protein YtjA (UPF0391 family)